MAEEKRAWVVEYFDSDGGWNNEAELVYATTRGKALFGSEVYARYRELLKGMRVRPATPDDIQYFKDWEALRWEEQVRRASQ